MNLLKKVTIAMLLTILIVCIQNIASATTGIVNTDTLNLRKGPSTNESVLKLLNRNEKVEILEETGDWYKVQIDGIIGYAHSDYIKKEEENTEEPNEEITNNQPTNNEILNNEEKEQFPEEIVMEKENDIYILPLINSTKISKTKVNEKISVIASTDKWLYISSEEVNGWVIKSNVIGNGSETNNTNTDNNTSENTNADNNSDNNKIDNNATSENEEIQIEQKTMYVNASSIYVRKGPGTNYEAVDSLILNSAVIVTHEVGDWYKVKVSGIEGYIAKRLLSETKQDITSRGDVERETTNQNVQVTESEKVDTQTTSSIGNQIVEYAKQYLGYKYVYGGSGPSTFDCSGFTMYVYNHFGVSLSHSATAQSKKGTYVAKGDLQPGDLVFFKDYETMVGIGHCGIYIGNGEFIHASSGTGYCVKISTLLSGSYNTRYETARRILN